MTGDATTKPTQGSRRRVLVGACGMGNGHSSRQLNLVRAVRQRGHDVAIVTFGDGVRALADAFATPVPIVVPTHFPGAWVGMTANGIDVPRAAAESRVVDPRGDAWSFAVCERVIEELGGAPDVVFSDYEPASAQIAYMLGAPLITTEQQSKFLLYRTPDVAGHTRMQEAAKLRYFFPAADQRIASSFFPMTWERDERYAGEVIEPILRPDVSDLAPEVDEASVVVYLSPYGPLPQTLEQVVGILSAVRGVRFTVFTKAPITAAADNVEVFPFDRVAFTKALGSCSAVVSTAGHQLLSECLYLGKPVLVVPFDVYEQQFNAMMVARLGIGLRARALSGARLTELLARRQEFAETARTLAARQFTGDSAGLIERLGL